jgi:hypothetical protein
MPRSTKAIAQQPRWSRAQSEIGAVLGGFRDALRLRLRKAMTGHVNRILLFVEHQDVTSWAFLGAEGTYRSGGGVALRRPGAKNGRSTGQARSMRRSHNSSRCR